MAKKHLIIGAGQAALSAADTIRQLDRECEIRLVSKENCLPYSPATLVYLLSGRVKEADLCLKDENYFRNLGISLVIGKEVTRVFPQVKKVDYHDGTSENYDTLLIASGAEPMKPPIPGLKDVEMYDFRTVADCRRLLKKLTGKDNVAILGAGMVGMKVAAG
jgi:NAD(P)H-nitrite reductase large subunit